MTTVRVNQAHLADSKRQQRASWRRDWFQSPRSPLAGGQLVTYASRPNRGNFYSSADATDRDAAYDASKVF